MQTEFYRKYARSPEPTNGSIPDVYTYLLPAAADNYYMQFNTACIFLRQSTGARHSSVIYDAWGYESGSFQIAATSNAITLFLVTKGQLTLTVRRQKSHTLTRGMLYQVYLPPKKRYLVEFTAGEHRMIQCSISPALFRLTGLFPDSLQKLTSRKRLRFFPGIPVDMSMLKRSSDFWQYRERPQLVHTFIYSKMLSFFREAVMGLPRKHNTPITTLFNIYRRLEKAKKMIDSQTGPRLIMKEVARQCRMNLWQLKTGFRLMYGCPFAQYQIMVRLDKAEKMLRETNEGIQHIALAAGYEDESSFTRRFKRLYGKTPLQYRIHCRKSSTS